MPRRMTSVVQSKPLFESWYKHKPASLKRGTLTGESTEQLRDILLKENIFSGLDSPFSRSDIRKSGYISRTSLEERLKKCISRKSKNLIVFIGPEGGGKTTTKAYVLRHVIPMSIKPYTEKIRHYSFDVKTWQYCNTSSEFMSEIIERMDTLFSGEHFATVREQYAEICDNPERLGQIFLRDLKLMRQEEFVHTIAAFLEVMETSVEHIIFCLDNSDQLPLSQQTLLYKALQGFLTTIEARAKQFGGLSESRKSAPNLHFIITLRPETWKTRIFNRGSQDWPFHLERQDPVEFSDTSDIMVWNLIRRRLRAESEKTGKSLTFRARSVQGYRKKSGYYELEFPIEETDLIALTEWLRKRSNKRHWDSIRELSGDSLRGQLHLGVKILAHPTTLTGYFDFINERIPNPEDRKDKSRLLQEIAQYRPASEHFFLYQATYDFTYWLPFESPRTLFNPFRIRDEELQLRNPLIGYNAVNILKRHVNDEMVYRSELESELSLFQYDKEAIQVCIDSLLSTGLIKPMLVDEGTRIERFVVKTETVACYSNLIGFLRKYNSTFFLASCAKDIFGWNGLIYDHLLIRNVQLLLFLLLTALEAERRLFGNMTRHSGRSNGLGRVYTDRISQRFADRILRFAGGVRRDNETFSGIGGGDRFVCTLANSIDEMIHSCHTIKRQLRKNWE